jgi:serine protease Do
MRLLPAFILSICLFAGSAMTPAQAQVTPRPNAPASFAQLTARLLPTVVQITTSQTLKAPARGQMPDLPEDSPLSELFKNFLGPRGNQPRQVTSLGSGFIIDPTGYIVTNNHVIENGEQVTVILSDETSLRARVVGRDPQTDLALLKVNPAKPLPATRFGDSDKAMIGDWVIAIGDPFGIGSTVTAGIISARNRNINAGPYDDFIQTDAPINRGNSGGPLFDMEGNVIGVNSAIFSPTGGSVGIGFSIPANLAREVVQQLRQFGQARRGWIGVRIQAVTQELAQAMSLPSRQGALISDVTAAGPAAKAGLRNGDLVVAFDGKPVPDNRALPRIVANTPIGKTVTVDVLRNGRKQTYRIQVARLAEDKPADRASKPAPPAPRPPSRLGQMGLSVGALDDAARQRFRIGSGVQGVVVTQVAPGSPAGEKNLRPGDVIVEVQGQKATSPDALNKAIEAAANSKKPVALFLISRGGEVTYVGVRLN